MITRKCKSLRSNSFSTSTPSITHLHLPSAPQQFFSTSTHFSAYSDTVSNLKIGQHTRVIFQGYTGRQVSFLPVIIISTFFFSTNNKATQNAKQSIAYGTKIVGGIIPGRTGEHLGLPLLPSVRLVSETFSSPQFLRVRKERSDHVLGQRPVKAGRNSHLCRCPPSGCSH